MFLATHDVELLSLLSGTYVGYHFAEQISETQLSFDYRIRPGASSTRNAIALLRLLSYPEEVIADALMIGKELTYGKCEAEIKP